MGSHEVAVHGLSMVTDGLLLNQLTAFAQPRMLRAGSRQLPALFQVAGCGSASSMPVRFLFHAQVPYEPGVRAMSEQDRFLIRCKRKTETMHANIIANIERRERHFATGSVTGVARPRTL